MANSFLNTTRMRTTFRAAVIFGLLALASVFIRPVTAAGPATSISISPIAGSVSTDGTQIFVVSAIAVDTTVTDVTSQSTVSVNDPKGTVSGATYTPGKAGTWTVQVAYQSFTATGSVTVTAGAVQEIVVNPNSEPEQTYIGTNKNFTAVAYDGKNNIVSGQTFVWSVLGENGSITSAGIFTPKATGTSKIQATIGTITGQISIVVNPALITQPTPAPIQKNNNVKNANLKATNTPTNTSVPSAPNKQETTSCTSLKPWVWIILLIIFLMGIAILFALVPITAIWPAVLALGAAVILAYIQRKYDCNGQSWWSWIVMLGTIALAGSALMMRPKTTPIE